jgi:hypothetical protein
MHVIKIKRIQKIGEGAIRASAQCDVGHRAGPGLKEARPRAVKILWASEANVFSRSCISISHCS